MTGSPLKRLCWEYGDAESGGAASRARWLDHRSAMILAVAVRRFALPRAEVPAALRLDGVGAIEALFNAARDSELAMLDELVERAGLGWKCQAEVAGFPCRYMHVGAVTCDGCGAEEAQGKKGSDG